MNQIVRFDAKLKKWYRMYKRKLEIQYEKEIDLIYRVNPKEEAWPSRQPQRKVFTKKCEAPQLPTCAKIWNGETTVQLVRHSQIGTKDLGVTLLLILWFSSRKNRQCQDNVHALL